MKNRNKIGIEEIATWCLIISLIITIISIIIIIWMNKSSTISFKILLTSATMIVVSYGTIYILNQYK